MYGTQWSWGFLRSVFILGGYGCTHSFRSEVLHSSELVHSTPSSPPPCPVIACLVEVTFLCHQLRSVRLRSGKRERGGGEGEKGGKEKRRERERRDE